MDGGFLLSSRLITTESCRIRWGPVFTASYWHHHHPAPSPPSPPEIMCLSVFRGRYPPTMFLFIYLFCFIFLFQNVSLFKPFCRGFPLFHFQTPFSSLLYPPFNPPILFLLEFHLRCRHIFISVSNTCLLLIIKRQL